MTNLTATNDAFVIDNVAFPKGQYDILKLDNGVRIFNINKLEFRDLLIGNISIDNTEVTDKVVLFTWFLNNSF